MEPSPKMNKKKITAYHIGSAAIRASRRACVRLARAAGAGAARPAVLVVVVVVLTAIASTAGIH
jgi:hypothetical protein